MLCLTAKNLQNKLGDTAAWVYGLHVPITQIEHVSVSLVIALENEGCAVSVVRAMFLKNKGSQSDSSLSPS